MDTINVKIIHPTNNSDIDIGLPGNIRLNDVFSQLIDANFLTAGQTYKGVLMSAGVSARVEGEESIDANSINDSLDNGKTIAENNVSSNDTIQILVDTEAFEMLTPDRLDGMLEVDTINVKIVHPTNNSDIDIGLPGSVRLKDVFTQLINANFLTKRQLYTGVLKPAGVRKESFSLDNDKTIFENGVNNNDTIQILTESEVAEMVLVRVCHPFNGTNVSLLVPILAILRDIFTMLVGIGFLPPKQIYTGVVDGVFLHSKVSLVDNGIRDGVTIQTVIRVSDTKPISLYWSL